MPTEIKLEATSRTVCIGIEKKRVSVYSLVKATILPENVTEKTAYYSNSNPEVLSLSNGGFVLVGNGIGQTVITIETLNGIKNQFTVNVVDHDEFAEKEIEFDDEKHWELYTCGYCGIEIGKKNVENHTFVDGKCKCGKVEPQKKTIIEISLEPGSGGNSVWYTGSEKKLVFMGKDLDKLIITGDSAIWPGKYNATVTVKDPSKYEIQYFERGGKVTSGTTVNVEWEIQKLDMREPYAKKTEYEYTGKEIQLETIYDNSIFVGITGNKATEPGEYVAKFFIKDDDMAMWDLGVQKTEIKWKIVKTTEERELDESEEEVVIYRTKIINTTGGKIKTNNVRVEEGKNQTFEIIPDEGYEIEDVLVDGKSVGAVSKYTLKDVKETHKITAKFKKIKKEEIKEEDIEKEKDKKQNKVEFEDIKENEWYYNAVGFVVGKGYFRGVENKKFAPKEKMNRAMLITVLYRIDGEKKTNFKNQFNDVEKGAYYEDALNWATENNIISGMSETEFAPLNEVTREQLVLILYRYEKLNRKDMSGNYDLTVFEDYDNISDYAKDALSWAVKSGHINGRTDSELAPKGTATRAEVATILMRYSEMK